MQLTSSLYVNTMISMVYNLFSDTGSIHTERIDKKTYVFFIFGSFVEEKEMNVFYDGSSDLTKKVGRQKNRKK